VSNFNENVMTVLTVLLETSRILVVQTAERGTRLLLLEERVKALESRNEYQDEYKLEQGERNA